MSIVHKLISTIVALLCIYLLTAKVNASTKKSAASSASSMFSAETEERQRLGNALHEHIQHQIDSLLDFKDDVEESYIHNKNRDVLIDNIDNNINDCFFAFNFVESIKDPINQLKKNIPGSLSENQIAEIMIREPLVHQIIKIRLECIKDYNDLKQAHMKYKKDTDLRLKESLLKIDEMDLFAASKTDNAHKEHEREFKNQEYLFRNMKMFYLDYFQMLNRTIVTFLSLSNLDTLPEKTKKLIRLCPSLWSKIQNPSDDWGNLEEALAMQDLDLFMLSVEKEEGIPLSELKEKYKIRPESIMCPLFNASIATKTSTPTPATAAAKKKKKSKKKRSNQVDEEMKISEETVETPKSDDKLVNPHAAVDDANESMLDTTSATQETADEDSMFETAVASNFSNFSTTTASALDNYEGFPADTPAAGATATGATEYASFDPALDHIQHQLRKVSMKPAGESSASVSTTVMGEEDLRLHESAQSVRGTHLATYNAILGRSTFQPVSFNQFKSLWEHLGGDIPNPKSGGSHRALKWQGLTIGGTFVPHGGHNYGPRCMKHIRTALEKITQGSTDLI